MRITCFIRYQIDPFQRDAFKQYVENWGRVIPRCGGHLVGYFLPYEGTNVQSVMRLMSALLLFACPCLAATCQRSSPANLRKDIDAGNQAWVDGLKAGDANHVVAGFAQDCVNCSAAGDCVKGLKSVIAQCQKVISKFGPATSGFVRSEALHVDHDLAYESGYSEARFPNGVFLRGRFSTVWKRQGDGHWKIFRNMSLSASNAN